jgi:anthranilate synthase component 1
VEGGESLARYSFIGAGPVDTFSGDESAFERVRGHLKAHLASASADLPPFIGGAVGFIGFEGCQWFERFLTAENDGECFFMLVHSIAAFDHAKQVIKLISLAIVTSEDNEEQEVANARRHNRIMRERIGGEIRLPASVTGASAAVRSNWDQAGFEAAVVRVKELIAAGECYQVVLSQRFEKPTRASPVSIYRALRSLNPSPYMFLVQFGEKSIIGTSPEMLVRCVDGNLQYRPIAGTRTRGATCSEDEALAYEMRFDEKENAEHMMLVDLGRNDLGRVCEYGSVSVRSLKMVEKYSHVQHMVSSLSGKLRPELDAFDALSACFPAGTVSGAPKVRAIEILRELEPTRRGVYAGAVGYFDYSGNSDTCIAIRTIELSDGIAKVQAGAGIVADSRPDLEYQETINKAATLLRAIDIAEEGHL